MLAPMGLSMSVLFHVDDFVGCVMFLLVVVVDVMHVVLLTVLWLRMLLM